MNKPVRAVVPVLAAAVLAAGCSSTDHPYAHESMPHQTAAERVDGASGTGAEPAAVPPTEVTGPTPTATAPSTPTTVPQTVSRMAPSDASFSTAALASSAVEIEMARVAIVRAQSPDVRAFAQRMLTDHRELAIRLDDFALMRGYVIPWQIPPEDANAIGRLSGIDTASFDRAYMDEMVAGHQKALARFEAQAASGRETAAIANQALPTVRHHLEMARDLQAQL